MCKVTVPHVRPRGSTGPFHPGNDKKLWEEVITEDFFHFRSAGLTHPPMAEIEAALKAQSQ